jgi:predicted transcriptional regulator
MNKRKKVSLYDMADMFICMQSTEANREDLHDLKYIIENGDFPVLKVKSAQGTIDFDANENDILLSLEKGFKSATEELEKIKYAYADMVEQYVEIEKKLKEVIKVQERIKDGFEDPVDQVKRIDKNIDKIEAQIAENINRYTLDDIDSEIKKLQELAIKKNSYRLKKTVKQEEIEEE